MDNETSSALKEFMAKEDIDLHQTPAYSHRHNVAERAIRTFQNHFIAMLCGADPYLPLDTWDQ